MRGKNNTSLAPRRYAAALLALILIVGTSLWLPFDGGNVYAYEEQASETAENEDPPVEDPPAEESEAEEPAPDTPPAEEPETEEPAPDAPLAEEPPAEEPDSKDQAEKTEAPEYVSSGTCGDNITWVFDDQGTLTLSGSGAMPDWGAAGAFNYPPWNGLEYNKVVIGEGITSIGAYAFAGYTTTGQLTEVELPESVEIIGNSAFAQSKITSIHIPSGVKKLGNNCFSQCPLESLIIPDSVTEIGNHALYNTKIKELYVPDTVISIGANAFSNIQPLEKIRLNKNITDASSVIKNCPALTGFEVADDNPTYCVVDGVLFTKDLKELAAYPAGKGSVYSVPAGTEIIGEHAFANKGITEVVLPEGVTAIKDSAFEGASELVKIVMPDTVTFIGYRAFISCVSLHEITLSDALITIGEQAFYNCAGLTEITIPDSVTTIGNDAFARCTGISEIVVPDSVTSLGDRAFHGCTGLESASLGNGLRSIKATFMDCVNLKTVKYPDKLNEIGYNTFRGCDSLDPLIIPAGVYKLGSGICSANQLRVIFLGNAPTSIHERCFEGCKLVAYYDDTNPTWTQYSGTSRDVRKNYGGTVCWAGALADPDLPQRMAGSKRQTTAVAISQATFPDGTDNVVIASGDDYPDALAGAPLAFMLDAPILLVCGSRFDQETLAEIERLGAKNAYILGGVGAINGNAAAILRNRGLNVERISGSNRFETAVKIAEKMDTIRGGSPAAAFFVYANDYPDALAISNVAAITGNPILYIETSGVLRDTTRSYMSRCGKVNISVIIGGMGVISSRAETTLKAYGEVARLYGSNRYETGVAINTAFRDILDGDSICVASGGNYPDALAGSVFAAKYHAPLMLVSNGGLIQVQKTYMVSVYPLNVFTFGGTYVVPDAAVEDVNRYTLRGKGAWG